MADTQTATADDVAGAYYVQQRRNVRDAANQAQDAWRQLDPRDIVGSWTDQGGVGDSIVDTVARSQWTAAEAATPYINDVVDTYGLTSDWLGDLEPDAWMGRAADGRPLSTLLWQPVEHSLEYIDMGMPSDAALERGLADMIRMVVSEVADAGRGATGAGIAANRRTTGYVRHLNPPSCARCVILAGKEYAFNQGFARHPRCDCVHIPSTVSGRGRTQDPQEYWHSLSRQEQDRLLGRASAQAVRDGADLTNVVNARRSTTTVEIYGRRMRISLDATTRRGWFYRSERRLAEQRGQGPFHVRGRRDNLPNFQLRTPRLLPEEIYRIAEDRDEVVRLLKKYGYIR